MKFLGSVLLIVLLPACNLHAVTRVAVRITGVDETLSDYPVKIILPWLDGMQADFSDIRFYDSDRVTPLRYWIEASTEASSATVWVRVPRIDSNSDKSIYLRFANGETVSASNGAEVFTLFDDFSGTGNTSWALMGRTDFYQRIYPRPFGCLLTDTQGKTVINGAGMTWLYVLGGGARAVPLNVDTLEVGEEGVAKTYDGDSAWASAHLVIKVSEQFYLMVYSASLNNTNVKTTRIATSAAPEGPFTRYQPFEVYPNPSPSWEGNGNWVESGVRYILETEDENTLAFWVGIENGLSHRMGWALVQMDKITGSITEVGRYPNNPLGTLLLTGDSYAYGGGNLDQTGLNLGVEKLMIYEGRFRGATSDVINFALSPNPFFDTLSKVGRLDVPLNNEIMVEKFQWVLRNGTLLLFYQLQQPTTQKATVVRKYKPGELPGAQWSVGSKATARVADGRLVTCLTVSNSPTADVLSIGTYGVNKAVRFRMNSGTTNKVEQSGFRNASESGAGVFLQQNTDGTWSFYSHDGTLASSINLGPQSDYGWHTIELARTPAKVRGELDGKTYEITDRIPLEPLQVLASGYKGDYGYSTLRDWLLVREYHDPEPTCAILFAQAPLPPLNVVATAQSRNEILLQWEDVSEDETAFEVYYSTDDVTYLLAGSTPANASSIRVTGLECATTYYFFVRALNEMGHGDSTSVSASTEPNRPPETHDDAYDVDEDRPLVVYAPGLLSNDSDPDGDPLSSLELVSGTAHGGVVLHGDGSFTYMPDPNYHGGDAFVYRVSDVLGMSSEGAVALTVVAVNDLPAANDDSASGVEGSAIVVEVLANDTDADGDALSVLSATQPANGRVQINGDSTIAYQPNPGFVGQDEFTYTATDSIAGASGSVIVTVAPKLLFADGFESANFTLGGWTISGSATADPAAAQTGGYGALLKRSTSITKVIRSVPESIVRLSYGRSSLSLESGEFGTVEVSSDGQHWSALETVTGTKAWAQKRVEVDFGGADFYLRFRVKGNEGNDTFMVDNVEVTGGILNRAPVAAVDAYRTAQNAVLNVGVDSGVLRNDSDPEGLTLCAILVSGPASGALALQPDGSFSYTPNSGFYGADVFSYVATDGYKESAAATVTLQITATAAPPVTNPDFYEMTQGSTLLVQAPGVLANDIDPNGDPLVAVFESGPTELILRSDGGFIYTPVANFTGEAKFTYVAMAGLEVSGSTEVTITVRQQTPPSMHIASILVKTVTVSKKSLRGYAEVIVLDGQLQPVPGALVKGVFTGRIAESVSGLTQVDGKAVLQTVGTAVSPVRLTFCVNDLTLEGVTYDSAADVEKCDKNYYISAHK